MGRNVVRSADGTLVELLLSGLPVLVEGANVIFATEGDLLVGAGTMTGLPDDESPG